jgi:hypothetical protein
MQVKSQNAEFSHGPFQGSLQAGHLSLHPAEPTNLQHA